MDEQALHCTPRYGWAPERPRHAENWQSEVLQLIWQVAGHEMLLHVGSPRSREGDDRLEEKLDAILRAVSPREGDRIIAALDERFDRGTPSA